MPITTKIEPKHTWVKEILFCSNRERMNNHSPVPFTSCMTGRKLTPARFLYSLTEEINLFTSRGSLEDNSGIIFG